MIRQAVVRNGHLPERQVLTEIGPVTVRIPEVHSLAQALVPPYVRKARSVDAMLPWLYLRGVASGQMQKALSSCWGRRLADRTQTLGYRTKRPRKGGVFVIDGVSRRRAFK